MACEDAEAAKTIRWNLEQSERARRATAGAIQKDLHDGIRNAATLNGSKDSGDRAAGPTGIGAVFLLLLAIGLFSQGGGSPSQSPVTPEKAPPVAGVESIVLSKTTFFPGERLALVAKTSRAEKADVRHEANLHLIGSKRNWKLGRFNLAMGSGVTIPLPDQLVPGKYYLTVVWANASEPRIEPIALEVAHPKVAVPWPKTESG